MFPGSSSSKRRGQSSAHLEVEWFFSRRSQGIFKPPPHYSEPSFPYSASSTFPGGPEETHLFFQMFVENCCGDRQQSKGGSPPN